MWKTYPDWLYMDSIYLCVSWTIYVAKDSSFNISFSFFNNSFSKPSPSSLLNNRKAWEEAVWCHKKELLTSWLRFLDSGWFCSLLPMWTLHTSFKLFGMLWVGILEGCLCYLWMHSKSSENTVSPMATSYLITVLWTGNLSYAQLS